MFAQQRWDLKKDKSGIKIYTASQVNSDYKCVKVECIIDCNFSQLLAVLFDIEKHHEWVCNTRSCELCKKVSDSELIYYSQISTPWPFSNRDFIAHLKVKQVSDAVLAIESHTEPEYKPCTKNCVRVKTSDAYWTITSLASASLKVEYIIKFDPGGTMPPWLINLFITEGPYQTFSKLKERVQAPQYRNAHFSFIK
jgi:hypothetical protein